MVLWLTLSESVGACLMNRLIFLIHSSERKCASRMVNPRLLLLKVV